MCNEQEDLQETEDLRELTFSDCRGPDTDKYTPPELSSLDTLSTTTHVIELIEVLSCFFIYLFLFKFYFSFFFFT